MAQKSCIRSHGFMVLAQENFASSCSSARCRQRTCIFFHRFTFLRNIMRSSIFWLRPSSPRPRYRLYDVQGMHHAKVLLQACACPQTVNRRLLAMCTCCFRKAASRHNAATQGSGSVRMHACGVRLRQKVHLKRAASLSIGFCISSPTCR